MPNGRVEATRKVSGPSWSRTIELVDQRRKDSTRYNSSLFGKLQRFYDIYRGYWSGRANQFRNQVSIPFTFAMIQSNVARKVQTCFGTPVTFEATAPEHTGSARKVQALVNQQLDDANSILKAVDFFLMEAICGTAVCRFGWKNVTRKNKYRKLETIAPGLTVPVSYEEDAELFNGPTWEPIDRLDFWQEPAKVRIDDMDWAIHRYWVDYDNLVDDANSPMPYFDPRAVHLLREFPLTGGGQNEWMARKVTFRNEYDYTARLQQRFSKPVEIWEMHGLVPDEFAQDGYRHRCIAIANERVVLKNREGPLGNQQLPFLSHASMPDPYSFDGVGKAEIAYGPQRTADRLNNQRLDLIDLIIDPPILANASTGINTQNLFSRAGRIFLLDGTVGDDNIRPLQYDLRGLQVGAAEVGELFSMMQLGTGETEALMGLGGQSRETARGFLGRQENALNRLSLESRLADEGFVTKLADAFHRMNKLWLSLPAQATRLGSVATVNPVTGFPIEESPEIDYDDLNADFKIRAVGSSQMIGKAQRRQDYVQLVQVLGAIPQMAMLINWANMARQGFEIHDFKNISELMNTQQTMLNTMVQGQGGGGEAGAGGQMLPQLSPDILGQMMNVQPTAALQGTA